MEDKPRIKVTAEPERKAGVDEAAPEKVGPPEHRWPAFIGRVLRILVRPSHEWDKVSKQDQKIASVLWPHVLVLILARAGAELIGHLLQDWSIGAALVDFAFSVLSWFVLVWIFAFASLSIASTRGSARLAATDAVRFAAYGLTPLFVVGILSVIPVPYVSQVADVVTMPYAFYVLSVGVVPMLRVPEKSAAAVAGLTNGLLLLLWALLPNLLALGLRALNK